MPSICIIGAGQLGSRHLQALQAIPGPLNIQVIDPSTQSLQTAKERYEAIPHEGPAHRITFSKHVDGTLGPVDVAIIATSANNRRAAVEMLLQATSVRYVILEKLLFTDATDYQAVPTLLQQHNVVTWVNCGMRTMPFYVDLKKLFTGGPIQYRVTGNQYGLITNAIHYTDYLSYLTGQKLFTVNTNLLDPKPFPSKRRGFLELNGTLQIEFADGSLGSFTCYDSGQAPIVMEIFNAQTRCISRESEQLAWMSTAKQEWKWEEVTAPIPYQSSMTTRVVKELLESGTCPLTLLADSVPMHLTLLNALQHHLNANSGQTFTHYPFT